MPADFDGVAQAAAGLSGAGVEGLVKRHVGLGLSSYDMACASFTHATQSFMATNGGGSSQSQSARHVAAVTKIGAMEERERAYGK